MKTITFYSYKGGVGRTLALVEIANRLAEFGKKVCVMDFDLEAPGLLHKYRHNIDEVNQGLVDYIYEFAIENNVPDSIGKYTKEITRYHNSSNEKELQKRQNNIVFIPAGNSDSSEYWKKLSHISWWKLFYEKDSEGIAFFLDLKEKIKKEFNPDYLLIDTRTGITEISAITMSILADSIVLFAVNNEENIRGTQRIIKAITNEENNLLDTVKETHFVLTRLPQITSPEEWARDEGITLQVKRRIEETFQNTERKLNSFNVIHANNDIALYDRVTVNFDFERKNEKKDQTPSISSEYLSLFDSLTENDLSQEEKEKFYNLKRSEMLLQRAYNSFFQNDPNLLEQLDEIEKLSPQLPDVYLLRGRYYAECKKNYEHAIEQFNKTIELNDLSGDGLFFRANTYFLSKKYQKALEDCDEYISKNYQTYGKGALRYRIMLKNNLGFDQTKLITEMKELIEKYPNDSNFYNSISCLYREQEKYELALKNIYKAIELNSEVGAYYSTLAEIHFCMDNTLEFFRNLDEALTKNYDIEDMLILDTDNVKNIYKQAIKYPEFVRILNKHNKAYLIDLLQKDIEKPKQ